MANSTFVGNNWTMVVMVGPTPDNSHRKSTDGLKNLHISLLIDFPGGASGKESVCQCRRRKRCRFDPWVGKIPWRRAWQPTLVSLPRESHGQRSLVGYSPWGRKESGMNEATEHAWSHFWLSPLELEALTI